MNDEFPIFATCEHGLWFTQDSELQGYRIQHGDNREAVLEIPFAYQDGDFGAAHRRLVSWMHEIHEYEGSNAVVSHV